MSRVLEMLRARSWPRAAALTLMTIGVAACSSDASRLHESPFGLGSDTTGSVAQGAPQGQPVGRVESRPLAPQAAQAQPIQPATKLAAATPGAGSVVRKPTAAGNWSWDGGKAITVGPGDTIDAIARRHGVPASVIIQANNIAPPATIYPGQRLVIPRYNASPVTAAAAPAMRPPTSTPAPAPAAATSAAPGASGTSAVHVVAAGDTLSKIARQYHKPVSEIIKANNMQANATLSVGDRLVIPGAAAPAAKPGAPAPAAQAKPVVSAAATNEPVQSANVVAPTPDALDKDAAKLAEGTGAL